jgi:alpha-galactosidase
MMNCMKIRANLYSFAAFALLLVLAAGSQWAFSQATAVSQPGLAPTPPMGWASWNRFFCDYNDQTIRDQADALVSSGMRDRGYRYLLIQECIAPGRNADGSLIVDAKRFPHGMKDLVDYVHSRGLLAGTYTDIGVNTCAGKPYQGSYQYEDQDASTFAAWGMDFVEMDYCNRPTGVTGREIYERMAAAIQKTGRPMMFYICSQGSERPWTWAKGKAQLWRTDDDISGQKNHVDWPNVVKNFESNAAHAVFSAPNSWNDPDMIEVGNQGLTPTEAQSHFSMWVISAAPLWAGNDLVTMSEGDRAIYTNAEAIAIDQDPLGAGAAKVKDSYNGLEVWVKPLGSIGSGVDAVMLLNLTAAPAEAAVQWSDLGLKGKVQVRDLWAHTDLGALPSGYSTRLPAHGSVLLKVSGEYDWIKGAIYEAEWPGNLRGGNADLIVCPDCSRGYAVSLHGSDPGYSVSSLAFTHIGVPQSGKYWITLNYVNSIYEGKTVQLRVNEGQMEDFKLPRSGYGFARVQVDLNKGDNSIEFRYAGNGSVDIDRLAVSQ